jgi:membrane dipeptidase
MFVLDSHCDTPSQIVRLRDLSLDNDHAQVDFPKLHRGGVDACFFALYTGASLSVDAARIKVEEMLKVVDDTLLKNRDLAVLTKTASQALENQRNARFSLCLGLENGQPIGDDFQQLDSYFDKGIRYVTLTHSAHNLIGDSCSPKQARWNGLSPFGKQLVEKMNELGMMVDISHTSAKTTWDALDVSSKPIIASHSSCQTLCKHPRNLSDDLIRAIADKGGVVQIAFYPEFLDFEFSKTLRDSGLYDWGEEIEEVFIADPSNAGKRAAWYAVLDRLQALSRPHWTRIVDHIEHAIQVGGVECVGLGSDFDGICVTPEGMEDISCMPLIFEELCRRGWGSSDIEKIAGANFLRCWKDNLG